MIIFNTNLQLSDGWNTSKKTYQSIEKQIKMSNEGINTYSKPKKSALKTFNSLQKVFLITVTLASKFWLGLVGELCKHQDSN